MASAANKKETHSACKLAGLTSLVLAVIAASLVVAPRADAQIRSYEDTVLWQSPDSATGDYFLMASVNGVVGRLPVPGNAPHQRSFDGGIDVGPGPDGSTWAVYSRCEPLSPSSGDICRLFRYSFADQSEQMIKAKGEQNGLIGYQPSIWGSRLAYVALNSRGTRSTLYVRSVAADGVLGRREFSLRGGDCDRYYKSPRRMRRCLRKHYYIGGFGEVELRGKNLALDIGNDTGGNLTDVRLVTIGTGLNKLVGRKYGSENGDGIEGLALTDRDLYFGWSCGSPDTGYCKEGADQAGPFEGSSGIFAYSLRSGRYRWAALGPWDFYDLAPGSAGNDTFFYDTNTQGPIESAPLKFEPTRAPIGRIAS